MASKQKTPDDKSKDILASLAKEVEISEAFVTAIFWNNPELYNFYSEEKLNRATFANRDIGFFFGLGRLMYDKGVHIFDDVAVARFAQEDKIQNLLIKYGDYDRIEELMEEIKGKEDNLDAYYADLKKYTLLRKLFNLFGEKVTAITEKYDYHKLDKELLFTYWNDRVNSIGMDGDNVHESFTLMKDLKEDVKRWSENHSRGLPFYKSKEMTKICLGVDKGTLTIFGGFGGSGKTSITFNKFILTHIEQKEKLLVIANEQSIEDFKKMLVITAMGVGTKKSFSRQRINEGEFTEDEFDKMDKAIDWVYELCEGQIDLIEFVFMEDYVMSEVKKIVRHYARRGYESVLIDTGKPSDEQSSKQRWETFTDDFKQLYKLARVNGGGLNLRMWVNVQLSDTALRQRYLNEYALGESKKIKNEADVVFMIRGIWADELPDGNSPLEVYRWVQANPKNPKHKQAVASGKKYVKEIVELEKDKVYYLLFTPKNRRGQDNKNGQQILVLEPNFNNNTWREIGWTTVIDDKNY